MDIQLDVWFAYQSHFFDWYFWLSAFSAYAKLECVPRNGKWYRIHIERRVLLMHRNLAFFVKTVSSVAIDHVHRSIDRTDSTNAKPCNSVKFQPIGHFGVVSCVSPPPADLAIAICVQIRSNMRATVSVSISIQHWLDEKCVNVFLLCRGSFGSEIGYSNELYISTAKSNAQIAGIWLRYGNMEKQKPKWLIEYPIGHVSGQHGKKSCKNCTSLEESGLLWIMTHDWLKTIVSLIYFGCCDGSLRRMCEPLWECLRTK